MLTVPEAKMLGASDENQLIRARVEGRVLFTQDEDFLRLHAAGVPHAGITYASQGTSVGEMVRGLMLIHSLLSPDEIKDHVEFV